MRSRIALRRQYGDEEGLLDDKEDKPEVNLEEIVHNKLTFTDDKGAEDETNEEPKTSNRTEQKPHAELTKSTYHRHIENLQKYSKM